MKLSHDDKYWPGGTQSKGALISGGCGGAITGIVFTVTVLARDGSQSVGKQCNAIKFCDYTYCNWHNS